MSRRSRFGWAMFAASGVLFLAIGIRDGDVLTVLGAAVWMIGVLAFLLDG